METRRFELVLESHLQKQAFLDLPRHSRDREERQNINAIDAKYKRDI